MGIDRDSGKDRIFFGWWMNLVTAVISGLGGAFVMEGASALFKPLSSELGFSRTATSVASTIRGLQWGLMAPLTGLLSDKFGPRYVAVAGIVFLAVGMIMMNFIHSLWAYYIVWGVILASGHTLACTIPVDKALTNWFVKKRGLTFALRFGLIGLVTAVVLPLITWMIFTCGWRTTCLIWAAVMMFSIPFMWIFLKQERPEYYGLLPDGARLESRTVSQSPDLFDNGVDYAAAFLENEFTLRQAMRTVAFWGIIVVNIFATIVWSGFGLHCIPFITDMGISSTAAGGMMAMMVFFTVPARFLGGLIADRISKDRLIWLIGFALILQCAGFGIFLANRTVASVYIFLILYGLGFGPIRPLLIIVRGRYFGRKAYGSIEGFSVVFETPLSILAPVYAGWIFDSTGSYIRALYLFTGLASIAAVLAFFIRAPNAPVGTGDIRKFL